MTRFVLRDLSDLHRHLAVDLDKWRGVLEILTQDDALDEEAAGRLIWRLGGEGTWIDADHVTRMAGHILTNLVPRAGSAGLRVESITFGAVESPTIGFAPPNRRPIILKREWLEALGAFCAQSGGLHARQEGL